MVEWSIAALREAPSVGAIVVACPPGHEHGLADAGVGLVDGGATRAESVANALAAVDTELIAIHDAARPLVTPELIEAVLATLHADPAAIAAIAATPVTDTVKQVGGMKGLFPIDEMEKSPFIVERTVDRNRLWAAQTPQVFRTEGLRAALAADPERAAAATDEAMVVEGVGGKVLIHPGLPENLKVTTPLDLKLAELLLAER